MNKITLTAVSLAAAMFCSISSASALECNGLSIPNALATSVLDGEVAGMSKRINRRKTLQIRGVESVSGSNCNINAKVAVKLKRKIRRDATGNVTLKGKVRVSGGEICLTNVQIDKVRVSNTLRLGEAVYRWVGNKVLPKNFCF